MGEITPKIQNQLSEELEKSLTTRLKGVLIMWILNLKMNPNVLEEVLNEEKNSEILDKNIPDLTQTLLTKIASSNIFQLSLLISRIERIEKKARLENRI